MKVTRQRSYVSGVAAAARLDAESTVNRGPSWEGRCREPPRGQRAYGKPLTRQLTKL
jgi:hypothetical protein